MGVLRNEHVVVVVPAVERAGVSGDIVREVSGKCSTVCGVGHLRNVGDGVGSGGYLSPCALAVGRFVIAFHEIAGRTKAGEVDGVRGTGMYRHRGSRGIVYEPAANGSIGTIGGVEGHFTHTASGSVAYLWQ